MLHAISATNSSCFNIVAGLQKGKMDQSVQTEDAIEQQGIFWEVSSEYYFHNINFAVLVVIGYTPNVA